MNFILEISLCPFFFLVAGSLMTTKHSQPQSTFAKSLTSTSTNTPYFKAAGTMLCCLVFLLWAFFLSLLSLIVKFLNYVLETCSCFHSGKRHYSITHYELLFSDLNS